MLAQLDDSGRERAIYYLSKRMLYYETRYVMIERFCLALGLGHSEIETLHDRVFRAACFSFRSFEISV